MKSISDLPKWAEILIRFGISVALTGLLLLLVIAIPATIVGAFLAACVVWALVMGWPLIEWIGESLGGLYWSGAEASHIRPQYSIAETCVKQGRYEDAIAAFRADIEKFPDETYPHIRIAELQLEHLHDPDAAIAELRIAVTKADSEDAFALVAERLADLLVQYQKDRPGAIEVLLQIGLLFPDSKHARAAAERIARLQ